MLQRTVTSGYDQDLSIHKKKLEDLLTNLNKIKKEKDQSKINELLAELLNLDADEEAQGVYIGVTATPARLDLNNTFLNKSERWVFLESHKEYIGREFFFPITEKQREKLMGMQA